MKTLKKKEPRTGKTVGVYISAVIERELAERDETRSALIVRELRRYYALLKQARREIRDNFTDVELLALADCLREVEIAPETVHALPIIVESSLRTPKIGRESLPDKLRRCTSLQLAAVLDAIERYNRLPETQRQAGRSVLSDLPAEEPKNANRKTVKKKS